MIEIQIGYGDLLNDKGPICQVSVMPDHSYMHICGLRGYATRKMRGNERSRGSRGNASRKYASKPWLECAGREWEARGKCGSSAWNRGSTHWRVPHLYVTGRVRCRATTLFREGVSGTGIICLATTTPVHVLYLKAKFLLHTAQFNEQFHTVMIYSCLWKSLWFTLWSLSWSWFSLPVSESPILISDVSPHCYQSCICLLHVLNA